MKEKFGYKVHINQYCTHSEYSDEKWGSWSEEYDNSFGYITKTNKYPDIVSDFDFMLGDEVYVVWVSYSTGDSFGWASGGQVEAYGVFKDYDSAYELKQFLMDFERNSKNYDYGQVNFETSDGQNHTFGYIPWMGYFESLDSVNIDFVRIELER